MTPQQKKKFDRSFNTMYALVGSVIILGICASSGALQHYPIIVAILTVCAFCFLFFKKS